MPQVRPVLVTIDSKFGGHYTLPNVDRAELERFLYLVNQGDPHAFIGQCATLSNMEAASLTIPFKNIKKILVGGEEVWACPA